MKYLNLTKGFNPYGIHEESINSIDFESFFFNGGEPHIKLDLGAFNDTADDINVSIRLKSMNDIGMLMVATEALQQSGYCKNINLFIPYFPGGRQDRRMIDGEPLTARVFADLINELDYDLITTFDDHSDVTNALLNNADNLNNHNFVQKAVNDIIGNSWMHLIIPDTGASKKMLSLNQQLKFDSVIKCDKTRDVKTGKLSGFEVYSDNLEGKACIIVDDICDGGGTFIGLAEELKKKNAGDLYLIVSHGIFSKGFKELRKHFKGIYTTDSWSNNYAMDNAEDEKGSEIVTIVPFKDFL